MVDNVFRNFEILKEVKNIKSFTFVTGRRNSIFRFRGVDLVMLDDAFFIFGFNSLGSLKFYKCLIILTENKKVYRSHFSTAQIPEMFKFNLNSFNNDVYIEFNEKSQFYSNVEIRLEKLTQEEKQFINIK